MHDTGSQAPRSSVRRCLSRLGLVISASALCGACSTPAPPGPHVAGVVEAIAALDPMFGHGFTVEIRALGAMAARIEDAAALDAALAPRRPALDAAARDRVASMLPSEHRDAALEFLESPAGQAVTRAEQFALLYPYHESLPQQTAPFYRDETRVGDAAIAKAHALEGKIAAGASPSPSLTAILVGARWVRPEHARAFGAFLDTEAGRAWLAARSQGWAESGPDFENLRRELVRENVVGPEIVPQPSAERSRGDGG